VSYSIDVSYDTPMGEVASGFMVEVRQTETDVTILPRRFWGTDLASGLLRAETAIRLDLQALDEERSGG
jgi:hypothetical protein